VLGDAPDHSLQLKILDGTAGHGHVAPHTLRDDRSSDKLVVGNLLLELLVQVLVEENRGVDFLLLFSFGPFLLLRLSSSSVLLAGLRLGGSVVLARLPLGSLRRLNTDMCQILPVKQYPQDRRPANAISLNHCNRSVRKFVARYAATSSCLLRGTKARSQQNKRHHTTIHITSWQYCRHYLHTHLDQPRHALEYCALRTA